jgi:predicted 2-oxoglutarate/Fe(II)-dependent dioxygenase YbiX
MMSKNIRDYLKVYKNFIDLDVCEASIKNLEKASWSTHAFYQSATKQMISYDHELAVSVDDIEQRTVLNQRVWDVLNKYIVEDFKDFHEWFNGWNGYSHVRFNRYDPTTQMKLHCDHIYTSLNNDYTGGELVLWEDEVIDLPAGAVVVFPSNFLYPHEVRPVKTGVRYSFVSWAW